MTGDGVRELVVATPYSCHVLQLDPAMVMARLSRGLAGVLKAISTQLTIAEETEDPAIEQELPCDQGPR
jgi:hypothetical protein